jgi:hypothetical protein
MYLYQNICCVFLNHLSKNQTFWPELVTNYSEDGSETFLRNIGKYLSQYTASHPPQTIFFISPPLESQISHSITNSQQSSLSEATSRYASSAVPGGLWKPKSSLGILAKVTSLWASCKCCIFPWACSTTNVEPPPPPPPPLILSELSV